MAAYGISPLMRNARIARVMKINAQQRIYGAATAVKKRVWRHSGVSSVSSSIWLALAYQRHGVAIGIGEKKKKCAIVLRAMPCNMAAISARSGSSVSWRIVNA